MISTSGIWNHATAQASSLPLAAMDSSGSGSDGSTSSSATISANDFLTLLVTEMQNQDPTADTDPNEYINQLVNVNSLEQLISINQTLTTAFTSASGAGGSTGTGSTGTNSGSDALSSLSAATQAEAGNRSPSILNSMPSSSMHASPSHLAPGNLSVPSSSPSAQRVAQSLNGEPDPRRASAHSSIY